MLVHNLVVVTQNVDGLHARAGSPDIIELHGHLRTARCDRCEARVAWSDAPDEPVCHHCGGMLRPDVVMFEENLAEEALERARTAAASCDLLISVGTSNLIWPARELPILAHDAGANVLIVNTDFAGQPTGARFHHLSGRAGDVLPELVRLLAQPEARL